MDTGTAVLKATDIHREFDTLEGPLPVLKGVTLHVSPNEMLSVTGASGVGKSTLLHILGGLDRPTQGHVEVCQEPLESKSQRDLARFRNRKIGFVFQFHYLLEDFTALENVTIPMSIAGEKPSVAREKGELLLEQVGLTNRSTHFPRQLSGGEQQRVAVARALANGPEIVLADEPSGNLDTKTGRMLHDLLFTLNRERSISFVIATHNRELADACPREVTIVDGKIEKLSR